METSTVSEATAGATGATAGAATASSSVETKQTTSGAKAADKADKPGSDAEKSALETADSEALEGPAVSWCFYLADFISQVSRTPNNL